MVVIKDNNPERVVEIKVLTTSLKAPLQVSSVIMD
jgi:hypothetical protein